MKDDERIGCFNGDVDRLFELERFDDEDFLLDGLEQSLPILEQV